MATFSVSLRFDDDCRNGHNTFSATAEVRRDGARDIDAGGCMHDAIAEHFPALAPLLKWHLCSSDGPMYYEANTLYLAGNLDCNGHAAGEPTRYQPFVKFGNSPIRHRIRKRFADWLQDPDVNLSDLEVLTIGHDREPGVFEPKYTFGGYLDKWHECPFDTQEEAMEWAEALQGEYEIGRCVAARSKGKERELDKARSAAIWPDASDEVLSLPRADLREKLRERLPALLAEFRADMESCGFKWAPPEVTA